MKAIANGTIILVLVLALNKPNENSKPHSRIIEFQPTVFVTTAGESVDVDQGWITVPENHSKPLGSSIRLPVVRFKSTAETPGPPIIYLAGGPGASGIESAKGPIFPLIAALRARSDVIVFDQRGSGAAEPSLVVPGKLDLPLDSTLDSPSAQKLINQPQTPI